MKKYAHLIFMDHGETGARLMKEFTEDLRRLGIIEITDERIKEFYDKEKLSPSGSVYHVVLHNLKEIRDFRKLMHNAPYIFENIIWRITWTPAEKEFGKWLNKIKKAKKLQRKSFDPKKGKKANPCNHAE